VTDKRCGISSLAIKVKAGLGHDPSGGDLFCLQRRKADRVKMLWNDCVGMSLCVKRPDAGKFVWLTAGVGEVRAIAAAQLDCLPKGTDWRNPQL